MVKLLKIRGLSVTTVLKEVKTKNEIRTIANTKVDAKERIIIEKNAKKYANGNLSLWIRQAAMNYKPRSCDLKEVR